MKGVCLRYANSEDDAEDILQEAFIRAFRKLGSYREQGSLGGWIRTITVNTAIELYRKDQRRKAHYSELANEREETVSDDIIAQLELKELLRIIQQLPDGYRVVFNLYIIDGFNHREIAEKLGISEGTSKSQFFRAKKLLQQMIIEADIVEYKNKRHAR